MASGCCLQAPRDPISHRTVSSPRTSHRPVTEGGGPCGHPAEVAGGEDRPALCERHGRSSSPVPTHRPPRRHPDATAPDTLPSTLPATATRCSRTCSQQAVLPAPLRPRVTRPWSLRWLSSAQYARWATEWMWAAGLSQRPRDTCGKTAAAAQGQPGSMAPVSLPPVRPSVPAFSEWNPSPKLQVTGQGLNPEPGSPQGGVCLNRGHSAKCHR
jgi:hypothetical protein